MTVGIGSERRGGRYRRGQLGALKSDRRLILVDARGHGASDKPHDPSAYDLSLRVGEMTAVLDDLAPFWPKLANRD
jgi:pimeloyl-ACP methyl ester carboxylesterase